MKNLTRTLLLAGASLPLLSTLPARSQDTAAMLESERIQENPFYVRTDLGGNWTKNTELKEFFGPVAAGSKVKFDPGVRFGLAGGYNLTDWFAPEAQLGVMENAIHSITDATRVHNAFFSSVPLMANVKFQLPNHTRFTPYVGGGLGVSFAVLDTGHIILNDVSAHGSASDAVFAYQGFAGVRYQINRRMDLGLEYHYFAAESPSWKADDISGEVSGDRIGFGRTETHSVSASFNWSF